MYRWIFDNTTIVENELIRTDDPSRFKVTLYRNLSQPLSDSGYGSLLLITNVQRDDLGIYECEVYIAGAVLSNGTTILNIEDHLLPAHTTESRVFSSTTIAGTKVFQTTTHTEDSKISGVTFSIIGGSVGLLLLAIVIILFIWRCKIRLKPQDEHITMTHPSSTNQSPSANSTYVVYQKDSDPEPYATLNHPNVSPLSDQQSADHPYTAYQRQPEPEPYATLNHPNVSPSSDQQSADHPYTAYQRQPGPEPYAALNPTNVSTSFDQQSADHPYTAYQRQPDPEPYATLNNPNVSPPPDQQSADHPYTAYQRLLVIGRSGGMVWEITVREVSYPGEAQLSLDMTLSARLFPIPYRR